MGDEKPGGELNREQLEVPLGVASPPSHCSTGDPQADSKILTFLS